MKFIYSTAVIMFVLFASCNQIKELKTMAKCQFKIAEVSNSQVAGIKIDNIKSYSDLNMFQGAKLLAAFASGNIPLGFTVKIESKNPNSTPAAIDYIEWIALIDDIEIVGGVLNERIEIPPNNGITIIPIKVSSDLKSLLKKESREAILKLGFGIAGKGENTSRVSVKLKPSLKIGNNIVKYPGYITIDYNFNE